VAGTDLIEVLALQFPSGQQTLPWNSLRARDLAKLRWAVSEVSAFAQVKKALKLDVDGPL
jgi:hypothetical protein